MVIMGCLMSLFIVLAPRVMLILAWIFSDRWDVVWSTWVWPLLGIIFAPYTTVMYLLVWSPQGIAGWDWMWIFLGVLLDVMKWGQFFQNRKRIPGYPQNDPWEEIRPSTP
ncbi:MAG: hypothetical protein R3C44_15540 [Chloroflexota bacterium]